MVNSKNTSLLFFILLLLLNLYWITGHRVPEAAYIVLFGAYITAMVLFSFFIKSGFYVPAHCRGDRPEKRVALTFDDGPDPVFTPKVLETLRGRAKATFFVTGKKIGGNEALLRRMNEEGHIVGNHSFTHSDWFDFYTPSRMAKELEDTDRLIGDAVGKEPCYFRPPYGVINPFVKKALRRAPHTVIGFSNRAWDTSAKDGEKVLERIIRKLSPGDIILLHDTACLTAEILPRLLGQIEKSGFTIVGMDELTGTKAYTK